MRAVAAAIFAFALACLMQMTPLSADTALAAPTPARVVTTWEELREGIANDKDAVFNIASLLDTETTPVNVTRDITLTANGAKVTTPELIVAKNVTLTLEDIDLRGNKDIKGGSATVRGFHAGEADDQYYGGNLIVGNNATLHSVNRPYDNVGKAKNTHAAMWLDTVIVSSGGTIQAETGAYNIAYAVSECKTLQIAGGSVLGTKWSNPEASGAVQPVIDRVQDISVTDGGTVLGNSDDRSNATATSAISGFFTCTLNKANVNNGTADFQGPVLTSRMPLLGFPGADSRSKQILVDITDTKIEGKPVKSNHVEDGAKPFSGYTWQENSLGTKTSSTSPVVITFNTEGVERDQDGVPLATVNLHAGAHIVGSSTQNGQGGWGICNYGGRVYVDSGASVTGGSTEAYTDTDVYDKTYNPTGGPAIGASRAIVQGGTVTGGSGRTGGPAIVRGYTSSVSSGTVTGGGSNWNSAGQAVYDTGTLNVTGGTLTGGTASNWYGGNAVQGVATLTLSGGDIVGGKTGTTDDRLTAGAGVYDIGNINATGGSITGGSATNVKGGPAISALRAGGSFSLENCTVTGGAGKTSGGAGIDAKRGSDIKADLIAVNSTISAGEGKGSVNYGGNGICNLTSLTLENCTVAGGVCGVGGPGIWNVTGDVSVKKGSVKAGNGSSYWGGNALSQIGGNLTVENAAIEGGAGASQQDGGKAIVDVKGDVTFIGGSAAGGSGKNGGNGIGTVTGNVTFAGGSAVGGNSVDGNGGAGLYEVAGAVVAEDATFAGGEGKTKGGEAVGHVNDLSLTNCTVAGGKGEAGGHAVYWTNAGGAGTTSIVGGTITGGESTAGAGATAVHLPAFETGSTATFKDCTIQAGAGVAGAAPGKNGTTGRGVNNFGVGSQYVVDNAVIKGSSDWGLAAWNDSVTVRGDKTLIAGGAVEGVDNNAGGMYAKEVTLEGGTVKTGTPSNGAEAIYTVRASDRFVMTGGTVGETGNTKVPAIALTSKDAFAAVSGGTVPIARGGVDIAGIGATWSYVQENENTGGLWDNPPTSSVVHPLYAVTALGADGSVLPQTSVAGAARSSLENPFDAATALCNADDATVVTFDRALVPGDALVVEARDWSKPGEVWVEVDAADAVLSDAGGQAQATFTVPERDVRVSLVTQTTVLEAGAVTQPDALVYGYDKASDIALSVKNAGDATAFGVAATLDQGANSPFEVVSGLTKDELAPGETAVVRVRLKAGMAGSSAPYAGSLTVGGSNVPEASVASFNFEQAVNRALAVPALGVEVEPDGSDAHLTTTFVPASPAAALPTGEVLFYEGNDLVAKGAIADGVAACDYGKELGDKAHTVTAVYGGDANYAAPVTPPSVTFDAHGQVQAPIEIVDPGALVYGDGSFELAVTGGSGTGAVSFEVPADNGVLEIEGSTAHIVGAGNVIIKATKAADGTFGEVQAVRTVIVDQKEAVVAFALPAESELVEDGAVKEVTAHVTNKVNEADEVKVILSGHTASTHGSYVATVEALSGAHARNYRLPGGAMTQPWSILYVADKADNALAGIKADGSYKRGEQVSFKALGSGMHIAKALAGDVRWLPLRWSVNPQGEFDPQGPFEATFDTSDMELGKHALTVVFGMQRFDGESWVSTGELSEKSVEITVLEKSIDPVDPVVPDEPVDPVDPVVPDDSNNPDEPVKPDPAADASVCPLPSSAVALAPTGDSVPAPVVVTLVVASLAALAVARRRIRSSR